MPEFFKGISSGANDSFFVQYLGNFLRAQSRRIHFEYSNDYRRCFFVNDWRMFFVCSFEITVNDFGGAIYTGESVGAFYGANFFAGIRGVPLIKNCDIILWTLKPVNVKINI